VSSLQADFKKFTLKFKKPMGTSRGTLFARDIYILALRNNEGIGIGECAPLNGLSIDDRPGFEDKLQEVCKLFNQDAIPSDLDLTDWPAVRFGLEAAKMDLQNGGRRLLFDNDFTKGRQTIPTNGLIVMADTDDMFEQVLNKAKLGFNCIKIKIGALDFAAECDLLSEIRRKFSPEHLEIRLDANGAFEADSALDKLQRLAEFKIHSIEQPIKAGQWQAMADLCALSPIPIALDEELTGVLEPTAKEELLRTIKPHYIILKPTLAGGLKASMEWIDGARKSNIGFWVTSALESNIGLNVISQWVSTLNLSIPQGLGTGQLFTANFSSPLSIIDGRLTYALVNGWDSLTNLADLKLTAE